MRRLIVFAILVSLTVLACQASTDLTSWLSYPSGSVLFQDEFSDPGSGWTQASGLAGGSVAYSEGAYKIRLDGPQRMLWSGPSMRFKDTRIEVDAAPLSSEGDDDFGIVCRAVDQDDFYFLAITSDGYYGIAKVKDGVQELIGMAQMLPSEFILKGNSRNHLRADCIADRLDLYVNGQLLASAQDTDFSRGRVGLMAGTLSAPAVEVLFDNFSVLAP